MFHSIKKIITLGRRLSQKIVFGLSVFLSQCMVYCYTYCDCCMDFGACDC